MQNILSKPKTVPNQHSTKNYRVTENTQTHLSRMLQGVGVQGGSGAVVFQGDRGTVN